MEGNKPSMLRTDQLLVAGGLCGGQVVPKLLAGLCLLLENATGAVSPARTTCLLDTAAPVRVPSKLVREQGAASGQCKLGLVQLDSRSIIAPHSSFQ